MKTTFRYPAQRVILAGAFALAVAAAPVIAYVSVPSANPSAPDVSACPAGQTEAFETGECVPNNSGAVTNTTPGDPNSLPAIQGIPCTGQNTGECIGLAEVQNRASSVAPESTVEGAR